MLRSRLARAFSSAGRYDARMSRRFQFSLIRLFWWTTCAALVAGVISWLPPEAQRDLTIWVQVFSLLLGMLFAGVFAIAVVLSCSKVLRRMWRGFFMRQRLE